jgi:hypothetical protein
MMMQQTLTQLRVLKLDGFADGLSTSAVISPEVSK